MNGTDTDPFTKLARALSAWPDMIGRLLAQHPPTGHCTGCTVPGGRAVTEAPCSIRKLAQLAQLIRSQQEVS